MSEFIEETEQSTSSLVDQLGTSPKQLARLEVDDIKLSFLVGSDRIPNQFRPALFFLVQNAIVNEGLSYEEAVVKYYFKLLNSINGRGQEILIKAENAKTGIPVSIEAPPEKPSLWDRLTDADKVRDYEQWKERKELGLE